MEEAMYDFGSIEKKQTTLEIEKVIKRIVDERTADVTSVINKIKAMLKDETTELSDIEIDDILLQLPILLYNSMENQEIVGLQSDMASQIRKEAQSEAYKLARGTIAERNVVVDLSTRQEQLEEIVYDRAYKIIRQKFEMALETLNAVKRIQTVRQQRNGLYDFSKR